MSQAAGARRGKVSGPVTGGRGWGFGSLPDDYLAQRGYRQEEYLIDGVADAWEPAPGAQVDESGLWRAVRTRPAPYKTRFCIVRPIDDGKFNGVVFVNWQNVTAGVDLGAPTDEEFFRGGCVWVGATVQQVAMTGRTLPRPGYSTPPAPGLPAWDPVRYGDLHHPGDRYAFDIYAQIARAVKGERAGGPDPLYGLKPRRLVATGASQSATLLAAYINMAHAHDRLFDGFLLLVHWGNASWSEHTDIRVSPHGDIYGGHRIRDDQGAPILVLNSETEAWSNFPVRQPDSDSFRFWEVAGGTHGGNRPDDPMIGLMERDGVAGQVDRNNPHANTIDWTFVREAAVRAIAAWVDNGVQPPRFERIEMAPGGPLDSVVRDAVGNARGGLRVPEMDAPVAVQLGVNATPDMLLKLAGERRPFGEAQLRALYPSRAAYLEAYDAATERLLATGGLLAADAPRVRARGRELADALPADL